MIINIKHEMLVFWAAFLCGQILGIFFDFFRVLRRRIPHTKFFVACEDVVFCIVAFKLFFDICYVTNNGNLRWYIFASLVCSDLIYFCIISKYILTVWNFLFKIIFAIFSPFKKIIVFASGKVKRLCITIKACVASGFSRIFSLFSRFSPKKRSKPHKNKKMLRFFSKKHFTFSKK